MARTTGPILAVGAVTVANQSVVNGRPVDLRVVAATGLAAAAFALAEHAWEKGAVALAWMSLVTVLFTRIDGVPSPTESFVRWWNAK
jgi:hypothetical protein